MSRRLLDTSVLIAHWRKCAGDTPAEFRPDDARRWAKELTETYGTDVIATPVVVEFLAGVRTGHELTLARVYLEDLHSIDGGNVSAEDWAAARKFAERVPRDGKPRQLGDCLIRAIADRFGHDAYSLDKRFSK